MEQIFSEGDSRSASRFAVDGSLSLLQQPVADPCAEPAESNLRPPTLFPQEPCWYYTIYA
jgi:hypothetical protein